MTHTIVVCTVKSADDGQSNSPKHVEFYSKNKLEKLVHLVGFIIRIYHDARSAERQILILICYFAGRVHTMALAGSITRTLLDRYHFHHHKIISRYHQAFHTGSFLRQKTRCMYHPACYERKKKGKVIPLQARCGPEGG